MKREIKFRAWDKVHQKYAEYDKGKKCIYTPFSGMENEFNNLNEDDFMFEQFTGLKDKTGVDIYEGDIIAFEKFKNFKKEYILPSLMKMEDRGENGIGWTQFSPRNMIVVIGNIHENKELLG